MLQCLYVSCLINARRHAYCCWGWLDIAAVKACQQGLPCAPIRSHIGWSILCFTFASQFLLCPPQLSPSTCHVTCMTFCSTMHASCHLCVFFSQQKIQCKFTFMGSVYFNITITYRYTPLLPNSFLKFIHLLFRDPSYKETESSALMRKDFFKYNNRIYPPSEFSQILCQC